MIINESKIHFGFPRWSYRKRKVVSISWNFPRFYFCILIEKFIQKNLSTFICIFFGDYYLLPRQYFVETTSGSSTTAVHNPRVPFELAMLNMEADNSIVIRIYSSFCISGYRIDSVGYLRWMTFFFHSELWRRMYSGISFFSELEAKYFDSIFEPKFRIFHSFASQHCSGLIF